MYSILKSIVSGSFDSSRVNTYGSTTGTAIRPVPLHFRHGTSGYVLSTHSRRDRLANSKFDSPGLFILSSPHRHRKRDRRDPRRCRSSCIRSHLYRTTGQRSDRQHNHQCRCSGISAPAQDQSMSCSSIHRPCWLACHSEPLLPITLRSS